MASMKAKTISLGSEADVLLHFLFPHGEMPPESARAILAIKVPPKVRRMARELSAKAKEGDLSPEEEVMMDSLERAGDSLALLQARARETLAHQKNGK